MSIAEQSDPKALIAVGPRHARILIIEDETMIGLLMEDELTDLGYDVIGVATSVDAALQAVDEEAFDLALLDLNLAGKMTGSVAEALDRRKIPYVVCTGYPAHVDPKRAVIIKPFGATALTLAIALTLEQYRKEISHHAPMIVTE